VPSLDGQARWAGELEGQVVLSLLALLVQKYKY
jgi:hypothetical protein